MAVVSEDSASTRVETPRSSSPRPGRSRASRDRGRQQAPWTPWLFMAPYLGLFSAFVLLPVVLGGWMSLHRWDYTLPNKPFVGLENYRQLFDPSTSSFEVFWNAMGATGIFTAASVPLLLVLPLMVALLMRRSFPGRDLMRAIYFAPYVLGVAVIAVLWRYLLDNNIGVVNQTLGALGLPDSIAWTTSVPAAWVTLVGVTVWWTLGFNAVIYLAALQDIPGELYEAARVDGASPWQQFLNVTLPGLRPIFAFIVVITLIASANMFGQSYLMTQGGPGRETRTAIYQITETGLRGFRMGEASAMSYVLTAVLLLASAVVFALLREKKGAGR